MTAPSPPEILYSTLSCFDMAVRWPLDQEYKYHLCDRYHGSSSPTENAETRGPLSPGKEAVFQFPAADPC